MMSKREDTDQHACGDCLLHGALDAPATIERRQFVRQAMLIAASLGVAMLARPAGAPGDAGRRAPARG